MAKKRRKGGRRKKASPAQLRALGKARAARKRKLRSGRGRRHPVRGYRRKGSRVKRHMSREEEAPRRKRRKHRRKGGKRRRARTHAYEAPRRKRRHGRRKHRRKHHAAARRHHGRRRHHRRGALENPLGGMELAIGALTGVVGYTAADVLDRFIATRASAPMITAVTGYAAAEAAPIWGDLYRLGAGVGIAAVPLIGAHFIKGPALRAALQFFGFGAAFNVLGKVVTGVAAKLLHDNDTGKRLYPQEIAAADAEAGLAGLPAGTDHYNNWLAGLGSCCRGGANLEQHKLQPSGGGMPPNVGAQQPMPPPVMQQPPQMAPPPPPFIPPPPVVARQPQTPIAPPAVSIPPTDTGMPPGYPVGTPGTTVTSPGPATPSLPPVVGAMLPASMLAGLGKLSPSARRQFQPAIDAINQNRDAFAALANRSATDEQHHRAQAVVAAHAPEIRAMHGLAALAENDEPSAQPRRVSPYRWGQHKNDAA
jgi:hypothetical protein